MDLWNAIKKEYIAGGTSYRKLALKYEVKLSALRSIAEREKWVKLRAQAQHKANTEIVNTVGTQTAKVDSKYFNLVNKFMRKVEAVMDANQNWSISSLKEMSATLKNLKECKGVKSEADMREQEARIKSLEKQIERENDSLTQIEVVFNAGEEEWNE